MKTPSGTLLGDYPFPGLSWVRDLEYFDGPLLTEYRASNNDRYLFYWVDCDSISNRWMVLRVNEGDILRLANRTLPLDLVIPKSCRDGHVYFIDLDSDRIPTQVYLTPLARIPDEYVPASGAYLSQPAEVDPTTFSVVLDGDLSIKSLSDLPRIVSQAYGMMYALEILKPSRFASYPWRGGFSSMHFYRWILDALLPAEAKPEILQWHYSSPGFIEFEMDSVVAMKMSSLAKFLATGMSSSDDAYQELYRFIRKNKLNKLLRNSTEWDTYNPSLQRLTLDLLKLLRVKSPDEVIKASPRPFEAAKIALSFAKRLKALAAFERDGLIQLPGLD